MYFVLCNGCLKQQVIRQGLHCSSCVFYFFRYLCVVCGLMGQCLSCCDDEHRRRRRRRRQGSNQRPSTPNGHGPASQQTSTSATVPSSAAIPLTSTQPPSPPVLLEPPIDASSPLPSSSSSPPAPVPAAAASNSSISGATTPPPPPVTESKSAKMFSHTKLPPIRKPSSSSNTPHNTLPLSTSIATGSGGGDVSEQKLHALFDHYREADTDEMKVEGIERFCADLNVLPEDFRILVLAWKFDAEEMCTFSRTELVEGCKKLHVDSIKGIAACLPELVKQVEDKEEFKQFYRWTYKFGLESGQRTLATDVAHELWKLVFSQNEPVILSRWLDFLNTHPSIRGIPRDTWDMLLNLTHVLHDEDFSAYDDICRVAC